MAMPNLEGIEEGVARAMSQACVYYLDTRKILLQVAQNSKHVCTKIPPLYYLLGMVTSASTSGFVFFSYFAVYNNFKDNLWAGPVSALASSFIKIPISNAMRVLQSNSVHKRPCLLNATKTILQKKGPLGLYNGYFLSLAEDVIEIDLRIRIYDKLSPYMPPFVAGSAAGFIVSYLTTPFDTAKTCLAIGIPIKPMCLYNGGLYRASSNALKSALFFTFLEALRKKDDV